MGCSGSKDKKKKEEQPGSQAGSAVENVPAPQEASASSVHSVEAPSGRAVNPNDVNVANTDNASTGAPANVSRRAASDAGAGEVDEDGNPVTLPKGDWVKTEGKPYYYSATENLYYHPPSCQFYDPTNEMWYDPETDEWYKDDGSEDAA